MCLGALVVPASCTVVVLRDMECAESFCVRHTVQFCEDRAGWYFLVSCWGPLHEAFRFFVGICNCFLLVTAAVIALVVALIIALVRAAVVVPIVSSPINMAGDGGRCYWW